MKTRVDRRTVDLNGYPDLVVVYLGMRVNVLTGMKTLLRLGPQIDKAGGRVPRVCCTIDAFFDVLKSFGSLSGIMCSLRDSRGCLAALSLTCALPFYDEVRKIALTRHMGDILMFQRYFHEIFVRGVLNEYVPAHRQGSTLSKRERECLAMAARGLTGEDIAIKLSISLRTVQHHFDSIRSKLGAANRQEAVYRAMRTGDLAA